MKLRIPCITLAILTLIAAGCSEKPKTPAQQTVDVGVVELNSGMQNRVDAKNGTVCIITPKTMVGGHVMLDMQIEKSGAVVASPRVEATPDQPVSISLDDFILKLTPHLK